MSETRRPKLLHKNYHGAKHIPEYLRIYDQTPAEPCKWCGASPKDIVVYDMPLKNNKRMKVTRCTVCDNLIRAGAVKERVKVYARRHKASSNN